MSAAFQLQDNREQIYSRLTSESMITANHEWLACMLASWCAGQGVLPDCLGLETGQFNALKEHFFPGCRLPEQAASGNKLDFNRMLERDDLVNLLKQFSKPGILETDWIIGVIVAGCLGSDHLWQDLGLWSRSQLSAMLQYNFPELAAKNDKDMKWKKFLYKQLCEAEGLYLCRAPSCSVCIDYPKCYGSEE
ncbi:MAG: nitrogen fixation protein NifQ [Methylobacter sp.]|uniref:nitrogen fixation protein NifQ n=1 Tax=Methylobacter sp. TaxID=2051955 RepID=UPI0025D9A118|nr:nitrogen fixation protein NifQ [Methylobacter sp.]MCK9621534.1 nitrogen fixation protein NifQ [Methylobacter sp.]